VGGVDGDAAVDETPEDRKPVRSVGELSRACRSQSSSCSPEWRSMISSSG